MGNNGGNVQPGLFLYGELQIVGTNFVSVGLLISYELPKSHRILILVDQI